jgi:prepilin-type N-terminal cleavage/methylation domain-containing protein
MSLPSKKPSPCRPSRERKPTRRGYTLIEAMVASVLLGVIVLAVMSAVAASQKLSFEGQKQMLGAMAADDLMAELATLPYEQLALRDGMTQAVGEIQTIDGQAYPGLYWSLGRRVLVEPHKIEHEETGIVVQGRRVIVTAFDDRRDVAAVETFIVEPAAK